MKRKDTEGFSKPTYLKILICVIGIGGVVAVGSYLVYRSNTIENATATIPIETTAVETETPIDNEVLRIEYENEARAKWEENIENLEGDKEAFVLEWVDLRISGLDVDSTYGRLYEKYQKKIDLGITSDEALAGLENNGSDLDDGSEPVVTEQPETADAANAANEVYTVIAIDPVKLYATANVNMRDLPDVSGNKIGSLSYGEEVTATGTVKEFNGIACYWLEVTTSKGLTGFVNGGYLVEERPTTQTNSSNSQTGQTSNSQTDNSQTGNSQTGNGQTDNSNSGLTDQTNTGTAGNSGTATPPANTTPPANNNFTVDSDGGIISQDGSCPWGTGNVTGGYKETPLHTDGSSLGLH